MSKDDHIILNDSTEQRKRKELGCYCQVTAIIKLATKPLDISDLDCVLDTVKEIIDWKDLGLKLGIYYPTLEAIDEEQRGRIHRCKREMLAAWLQGEDNAKEQSWSTLVNAIEKIDLMLAEKVRQNAL